MDTLLFWLISLVGGAFYSAFSWIGRAFAAVKNLFIRK